MVIGKGGEWGTPTTWQHAHHTVATDHEMAMHAAGAIAEGAHPCYAVPPAPSEVAKALGLRSGPRAEPVSYPFDLAEVTLSDGASFPFVATCEARRRMWRGQFLVAMNVGWLGRRYLGPRAHPNDGLLDITTGRLGWRQRIMADRKARVGGHLPHPQLRMRRQATVSYELASPVPVRVDGQRVGRSHTLHFTVYPDAITVIG